MDRVADVILVFDLGFGERRLLDDAPHHRLGAAVKQAVGDEFEDLAGDLRLRGIAHRQVGVIPVADHAKALELLTLHVDPMIGIRPAFAAKGDDCGRIGEVGLRLALLAVKFLLDLPFDRQAVAVPTRNVVRILAGHLVRADDHVLEDLVERGADVDIAVGVGRPVVQDELRPPFAARAELSVEVVARPASQNLGLLLRQARPHREIRLRQIERLRIVEAFVGRVGHEDCGPGTSLRGGAARN